jgi:hypothetical protein
MAHDDRAPSPHPFAPDFPIAGAAIQHATVVEGNRGGGFWVVSQFEMFMLC